MSKKNEGGKDNQKNQRIQVFARCRPINSFEKKQASPIVVDANQDKKEIKVKDDKMINKTFVFDKVFGPKTKQIAVYKAVVGPLIREVMMGYNCTVFAYGQTGTGKTYTMEGERSDACCSWEEDPSAGIIPRSLHQLFEELTKEENVEFSVHVSFLELYNEELFDLLSPNDLSKLRLFEDSTRKGSVVIQGLEEIKVNSKDEVYSILEKGTARRQKAATLLNATSSRSHTVFSVTVHIKENTIDGEELLKTGKLNLVDLAGSENIGRSGASQKTAREAGNINQSLLTLGRVITSLVEKAPHIPYRESKLTRLLQDSLGGHTKTSIIATVSPALCNIEETISTLDYAQRAKNITIKPEVNQKMTKKALIKEYTEEIERLRKDLVALRDKNGFYIDMDNYNLMQQEISDKANEISDLVNKIEAMTSQMEKIEELFTETKDKLTKTSQELVLTSKKYNQTTMELSERSRELAMTQQVLADTALERDENRYLVEIQSKTEKKLTQQAQQLMEVADETTSHVTGLHAKIDRKKNVEKTNEERSQMFRSNFQKNLLTMNDIISNLGINQINSYKVLENDVGNTLSVWSRQKEQLFSCMNEFINTSTHHMEEMSSFFNQDLKKRDAFFNGGVNTAWQTMSESLRKQEEFLKSTFNMLSISLMTGLGNLENLVQNMQQELLKKCQQQEAIISSSCEKHIVLSRQLSGEFDTFWSVNENQMKQYKEIVSGMNKRETTFKTKANEDVTMMKKMISSLEDRLNSHFSEMCDDSSKLQDMLENDLQAQEVNSEQIKRKFEEIKVSEDQLCDELFSTMKDAYAYQCNNLKNAEELTRNLKDDKLNMEREVIVFFQKMHREQEENFKEFQGHTNLEKSRANTLPEDVNRILKGQLAKMHSTSENVNSIVQNYDSHLNAHIEAQLNGLAAAGTTLQAETDRLGKEILCRDLEIEKFLFEDLQKDVPTGATPQRKSFEFPRYLYATSPHDRILQRFRSQLQQNTAKAVDLPLNSSLTESSDGSITTGNSPERIPLLRLNSCNNSDDSYCDESDSSISSQSDASLTSITNKENCSTLSCNGSKLPRKIPRHKKTFAKPQSLAPQRKPLQPSNEQIY